MEIVLILIIAIVVLIYIFKLKKTMKSTYKELNNLKDKERTFEQTTFIELENKIEEKKKVLDDLEKSQDQKVEGLQRTIGKLEKQKNKLFDKNQTLSTNIKTKEKEIESLNNIIDILKEDIELQDYGVYKPRFDFASALQYKDRLNETRALQKSMIKDKTAVLYSENWTVDGSKSKGKKMMNDSIKQILRSFNNECDVLISKVTYKNFDSIQSRIEKIFDQLNKLNETQRLSLTRDYLKLKYEELHLAFEYARKKEEEKEALRQQREIEREEKALQKEIENKKKVVEKDINHYKNLIERLKEKMSDDISKEERISIENEITNIENNIKEKQKEKEELDYREVHSSAGYVYVISNIGAFGQDVVKIGVTRRLDPIERIKELSSASVPFTYDIHALIFSYEAYELESELHQYFTEYRLNKVNTRKEFFKVSIDKIEKKLEDYGDLTIDFKSIADAEEYRESLAI